MADYKHAEIEKKWQQNWKSHNTYTTTNESDKPKYYVLDMFPYPSGAGLHVGHPLGYIASDVYARYKKLKGYNVLHPMGFDAFGLPAEQYAIQTGQHPAITTKENIATYIRQLNQIGFAYDWAREVRTSDPKYYKHTQVIFRYFFKHWFNKITGTADSIDNLVSLFASGGSDAVNGAVSDNPTEFSAEDWQQFSEKQKEEILQQYRLAFLADLTVNWCPGLGTVLANEEVKDGVSERGGFLVERKQMRQWSLRISAYADRLLEGLDGIDWPDPVKEMQRNWIGKSIGTLLKFRIEGNADAQIEVFTTRVDTIFGVTFVVLAPEHDLVKKITTDVCQISVEEYLQVAKNKSERERMSEVKTVSGCFTGAYAINPFNNQKVPIYTADYVLAGYGTGAVMGVPSSDTRDYAFAKHFSLPIVNVQHGEGTDITSPNFNAKAGIMINSGFLDGLCVKDAIIRATNYAEEKGFGKAKVNFRLRDAIFSRQRYWGEPIPVYFDNDIPKLVPEDQLPLILPEVDAYKPTETGEPPLARANNWQYNNMPLETNTMPGWAGSSWYFFRYMDVLSDNLLASEEALQYWKDVDLYIGGAEHATGHLLYARFFTKFLFDIGKVPVAEPVKKLINQGMIQGVSEMTTLFVDNSKEKEAEKYVFYSADKVPVKTPDGVRVVAFNTDIALVQNNVLDLDGFKLWRPEYANATFHLSDNGVFKTRSEVEKMSKSKFNVVNPDQVISRYGADTLRLFEMFLGPLEQFKPWSIQAISGTYGFLRKFWRLSHNEDGALNISDASPTTDELRVLHKCLKKVEEDLDRYSFNTVVSTFMICVNELTALKCHKKAILEPLTICLSMYAPHIAEEVWQLLGNTSSVTLAKYPAFVASYIEEATFECPVSFNGKTKGKISLAKGLSAQEVEKLVRQDQTLAKWLDGVSVSKFIVVPNRIVNIVGSDN